MTGENRYRHFVNAAIIVVGFSLIEFISFAKTHQNLNDVNDRITYEVRKNREIGDRMEARQIDIQAKLDRFLESKKASNSVSVSNER